MILSRNPILALGILGVAAACSSPAGGNDSDEAPYLVATTSIWADLTSLVACDGVFDVRTLVPPGGDAHAYEPSLRDREVLDGAALVIANGLGLESTLDDTIDDVVAGGVQRFTVTEHVDTIPVGEHGGGGHDDGHEDGREGDDPHVWFDPQRVSAALGPLGEAVVAAGGDRAATERCVEEARVTLVELDADVDATLAAISDERRLLVTNHDSLGYFADRYGFEVLGTVLPSASTLTEAGPAQLEALGEEIRAAGVPAIFTETLHGNADAEALADRLGVEVVELYTDALGAAGSPAETYAGLLRTDAERIATALGR